MSGVPDMSIAERFTALHDRMDHVSGNILNKIDEVRGELSTQMHTFEIETIKRFGQASQDIARIELRIDKIYNRLDKHDGHFHRLEADVNKRFVEVDKKFAEVDRRFDGIDQRLDQLDTQFCELKQDVGQLKQDVGELKLGMVDIMSMLASLGATAPERRVN